MKRLITLIGLTALSSVVGLYASRRSDTGRFMPDREDRLIQNVRRFPSDVSLAKVEVKDINPLLRKKSLHNELLPSETVSLPGDLCGYLVYSSDTEHVFDMLGWNLIDRENGQLNNMWVDQYSMSGYPLQSVFIRDGRLCGYYMFIFFDEIYRLSYVELDLETGEILSAQDFTDSAKLFMSGAYIPSTDEIYGFTLDAANGCYQFARASVSDPVNNVEYIKSVDGNMFCQSFTYNEYEDMFYGINGSGDMVEIDRWGNQRIIMQQPVGNVNTYISGLVYSPLRQAYYYNSLQEDGSAMYELNPYSGQVRKLFDFPTDEEFASLFCNESQPLILQRPEIIDIDFDGPSTSGSITWQLPASDLSGNSVTDAITYIVSVDGNSVTEGSLNAGGNVIGKFENLTSGLHTFSLSTLNGGIRGMRSNLVRYIGYDRPMPPENVVLTDTEIIWQPIQSGVNGGYIDKEELQYQVWVDDQLIATTRETSIPCGIDLTQSARRHHAYVIAENHGVLSDPGRAPSIVCGAPDTIPASWIPTEEETDSFEIIDANQDTFVWFYNEEYDGLVYSWDYSNEPWNQDKTLLDGDDWVILPPVMCDDSTGLYRFSMDVLCFGEWSAESFEIWCGDKPTVDGMSEMIFQSGDINNTEDVNFECFFTVDTPSVKYLAIRSTVKADCCDAMRIRNFLVEKAGSINGPAMVSDLKAVAEDLGKLEANVTFTLPTLSYSGSPLSATETLTAEVTAAETTVVTGLPGETLTVKVITNKGTNIVTVNCRTSDGLAGKPSKTTVFTGLDVPGAPTDVKVMADADNLTLHFSWTPSTEGLHGGYVDPDKVTYCIGNGSWFSVEDALVMGTGITEYTYKLDEDSTLETRWFSIAALDEDGQYDNYSMTMIQAGRPLGLPITELFEDGQVEYAPEPTVEDPASWSWGLGGYEVDPLTDGVCNENGYGFARQSNSTDPVWLALPRFSTLDVENPAVVLTAMCGNDYSNVEIYALTDGMSERIRIGEMEGEGWQQQTFVLPDEFRQRGWVEIDLKGVPAVEFGTTLIGAYEIKDYLENDLRLRWYSLPERISIGQKTICYAKVQNVGFKAMDAPDIDLTLSNRNRSLEGVEIKSMPKVMQPGEIAVVEFEVTPSADFRGELSATLTLGADDDMTNNKLYGHTTVLTGRSNVVTDLKARQGDDGMTLTWSAPMSDGNMGFEEEVFAQLSDELSVFRNLDLDGQTRMSFISYLVPVPYYDRPAGWMVWNEIEMTDICVANWSDPIFFPGEGVNSVVAFCPENGEAANDLIISPRVKGDSEISFMAVPALIDNGPEIIEIMVSSTDDSPESFRSIKTISVNGNGWCDYSSTLPPDTKYFALKYASSGMFGVFVDKICYTPDPSDIDHYEIWRDDSLIDISETTMYIDTLEGSDDGMHTYNVVPVMKSGEKGLLSNTVRIQTSGVEMIEDRCLVAGVSGHIRITGYEGETADVYAADGIMIVSATVDTDDTFIAVGPGIYIVAIAGKTYKVIVG